MSRRRQLSAEEGDDELLLEFCVTGVALSAQAKNRQRLREWQKKVASQARIALADAAMIEGAVDFHLSEFSETKRMDRDNVAKPMLDAVQGIVISNDRQVARLRSEWCDIDDRYRVRFMSKAVAEALVAGREFVWIRIYRHRPRETLSP